MIGTITIGNKVGLKPSAPAPVLGLSFAGDAAYLAGGTAGIEAAIQAKLGQGVTLDGILDVTANATHYLAWNAATGKLVLFVRATGVEAVPGNYSATTFRVLAFCR